MKQKIRATMHFPEGLKYSPFKCANSWTKFYKTGQKPGLYCVPPSPHPCPKGTNRWHNLAPKLGDPKLEIKERKKGNFSHFLLPQE